MVDEHRRGMAVDDNLAVAESKEVSDGFLLVEPVSLIFGQVGAAVFGNAFTLSDRGGGIAAGCVNGRRTDDESHQNVYAFIR